MPRVQTSLEAGNIYGLEVAPANPRSDKATFGDST